MESERSSPATNDPWLVSEDIQSFPFPRTRLAVSIRSRCSECYISESLRCLRCVLSCPKTIPEESRSARLRKAPADSWTRSHHRTILLSCCKLNPTAVSKFGATCRHKKTLHNYRVSQLRSLWMETFRKTQTQEHANAAWFISIAEILHIIILVGRPEFLMPLHSFIRFYN